MANNKEIKEINGIVIRIGDQIQLFKLSKNNTVMNPSYPISEGTYTWLNTSQIAFVNQQGKKLKNGNTCFKIKDIFSITLSHSDKLEKATVLEVMKDNDLQKIVTEVITGALLEAL